MYLFITLIKFLGILSLKAQMFPFKHLYAHRAASETYTLFCRCDIYNSFVKQKVNIFTLVCFAILVFPYSACAEQMSQVEFIDKVIEKQKAVSDSFIINSVKMEAKLKDGPDEPVTQSTLSYQRLETEYFSFCSMIDSSVMTVTACNPQYEFELEKSVSDKTWRILDLKPKQDDNFPKSYACTTSWDKFQGFLYIAGIPLAWLLSQHNLYEITDYQEETQPDKSTNTTIKLKIIEPDAVFQDKQAIQYITKIGYETVEIKFNTNKYGCIPYEYTITHNGNMRTVIYSNFTQMSGINIPTNMSSSVTLKDGTSWSIFEGTILYVNTEKYKKSHFYISYYGLPEPDFGDSRPNRVRYIMMTLGGILILLAGWQMYQKLRDKQEETSL